MVRCTWPPSRRTVACGAAMLLQRLQRLVGAPFLPEADGGVQQHDDAG
jgi:hypothetical protein